MLFKQGWTAIWVCCCLFSQRLQVYEVIASDVSLGVCSQLTAEFAQVSFIVLAVPSTNTGCQVNNTEAALLDVQEARGVARWEAPDLDRQHTSEC